MTVQNALDKAAESLTSELPISDWGHWLIYLFERLERAAERQQEKQAFDIVLLQLRSDIDTKLLGGRW
ncbi:MAG: hypothetical protein L0332_01925 [Chloroflexi bacterium]|nr:hypothetical protein [Chloroflexota bacterium]MCI0580885.1 hypothetical protein [Chloroflexota bacterium]MCI0649733.1 hypothetical protein [Chloroflexota bacterium]MCI0725472.1 hypothetical protein [Chloroflexota bacterium]